MIEAVEKSKTSELDDLTKEVGQAFFDYGRTKYEIELKERQLADISIKIHNLNKRALEIRAAIEREAKKEAMKVSLSTVPGVQQ